MQVPFIEVMSKSSTVACFSVRQFVQSPHRLVSGLFNSQYGRKSSVHRPFFSVGLVGTPRIRKTEDPHTQDHQRKTFSQAVGFDSTFYM